MASNVLSKEWGAALITKVKALLGNKVDKVAGKGLSTNDLTTALKTSYDGAVSGVADLKKVGAEKNTIVGIKVNGTAQTVDSSRNVDLTVPTGIPKSQPKSRATAIRLPFRWIRP